MKTIRIYGAELYKGDGPIITVYQADQKRGAIVHFHLTPENIQEIREAADQCEKVLADYNRKKEIEARVKAEMEGVA